MMYGKGKILSQELDTLFNECWQLSEQCEGMLTRAHALMESLQSFDTSWPNSQVKPDGKWHPAAKTPPDSVIWASDGTNVWLIRGTGKPLSEKLIAVKYWTVACIPAAPRFTIPERLTGKRPAG